VGQYGAVEQPIVPGGQRLWLNHHQQKRATQEQISPVRAKFGIAIGRGNALAPGDWAAKPQGWRSP